MYIVKNEKFFILIQISRKCVPKGLIDNKPPLVPVMAWRRTGDKPLPEPMLIQFTAAYAAQGEWVNDLVLCRREALEKKRRKKKL